MGHGKLKKFAENETFRCLLQPEASSVLAKPEGSKELILRDHPIKGRWNADMFAKDQPIVLELGCGKGDYTIALARRHPEMNFIGVDIKGARLWKGAKEATEEAMGNVAFLRTRIEFIDAFFGPGEVSEIWLTFSDPQLRGSENARLTSPLFLQRYSRFLAPGGIVHLKTDSRFLHEYTRSVIRANDLEVLASGTDIYSDGFRTGVTLEYRRYATPPTASGGPLEGSGSGAPENLSIFGVVRPRVATGFQESPLPEDDEWDMGAVFEVQTFYEKMFLEMGLPITYLAFRLGERTVFAYPTDFDAAYWREAEGPRRSFSHQPTKGSSNGSV